MQRQGAVTFDYGNNLRAQAVTAGVAEAFQKDSGPSSVMFEEAMVVSITLVAVTRMDCCAPRAAGAV